MMKTSRGQYVIFDITEYLPGEVIPPSFTKEANEKGPFFFQPTDWTRENDWGGSAAINIMAKSNPKTWPFMYSTGFATAESALDAAQKWEDDDPERLVPWPQRVG